jgi:hypothetical protein
LEIALLDLNYSFKILVGYKFSATAMYPPREVVGTLAGTAGTAGTAGRTDC